jgi:hypothetical protein
VADLAYADKITKQILDYLRARGREPILENDILADGTHGEHTYKGDELSRITIDPWQADAGTLPHEMTHAAEREIGRQYYESIKDRNKLRNPTQFEQGYEKLRQPRGMQMFERSSPDHYLSPQELLAKKLRDPKYGTDSYRYSAREIPAYGVGNAVLGEQAGYRAAPHIDPTAATEMEILLELAARKKK